MTGQGEADEEKRRERWQALGIRTDVAHPARVYDYLLGGCSQPASACHVHHVRHKARGGKTSVTDCVLLCPYHHLIVIHQQGWTLTLNGDGTTPAWNKDHTKVLHSHGPPARPG